MKIRSRIALVAAVAVAVGVVVISAAAFLSARRELRSEIDQSLVERALVIQSLADDPRGIVGVDGPMRPPLGLLGGRGAAFDTVYYQVTLPTGDVLVPEGQTPLPGADGQAATDQAFLSDERVDAVHVRMVVFTSESLGVVQIARPLTEVDATLAGLAVALVSIGMIGVLLAGVAGLF
ncbi:MAG: sensor histidine kinase N-terminal domain-containing protein, partial [Acidimicrobiia bacterium]|nr:sensor histidine kinase N-terminal domain-containing protein [Acidimicrobiia bacterium]